MITNFHISDVPPAVPSPINVTRSYLPPWEEYVQLLRSVWESHVLTNQGPCVLQLQQELQKFLDVPHLLYVTNGTVALHLALAAADIREGEVITTPFSYVATTSSILWERCTPVFVDIEPEHFTIDPARIESAITSRTRAIMAVHVFGYACNVEAIAEIGRKYGLPVIYDGAHAFGARYKGKSLLSYGDYSTCSFHATKLFHTVEGGAVITHDAATAEKLDLLRRFGHNGDEHISPGINAKQSELHAAMGLANLPHMSEILAARRHLCELYDILLGDVVQRPTPQPELESNCDYYPVLFRDEAQLLAAFAALRRQNICPRRYFYPSLNRLPYLPQMKACPISENIASRIACLPLFAGLGDETVKEIASILNKLNA